MNKIFFIFFFLSSFSELLPAPFEASSYPNFQNNPYLNEKMRVKMGPYLLPLDHPLKATLDLLFSQSRVVESEQTLADAGFITIAYGLVSFVTIVKHPMIPGYIFKLYLDSEKRSKEGKEHWEWLTNRCIGAENIRKIIKKKKIGYFTVPDKWLYILPVYPFSRELTPQSVIVAETDMEPKDRKSSDRAWRTRIKRKHLDELYLILKHGYGSTGVTQNIPYTKSGKFAFIDTEYPKRCLKLKKVEKYLSEDMQRYWNSLIRS